MELDLSHARTLARYINSARYAYYAAPLFRGAPDAALICLAVAFATLGALVLS